MSNEEAQRPPSVLRSVRLKCLDCSGGSSNEVKVCPIKVCPLFPYRFGRNPNRVKKEMTDEQRAAMSERMRKMQATRKAKSEEQGA